MLLTLHGVRASPDGVLFRGWRLLPQSFAFPANRARWTRLGLARFLAVNYLGRKTRRQDRTCLWVTDDWSTGYFHWLTDVLPRLLAVREWWGALGILLPATCRNLPFVPASLALFPAGTVEYIGHEEVVRCRRLVVPTHTAPSGNYDEELVRQLRKTFVDAFGRTGRRSGPDRLYVSRRLARRRRLVNEDEVVDVLQRYGFAVIRPEEHPFEEQVALAAGARFLVANHGAGLTNMLFMARGSVLELRHRRDGVNNCYFNLASALDLGYFYQLCPPAGADTEDPHTADLVVDPSRLRANVELMLASG
jgi:capsular polysaccharide biosynthesis protein